MTYAAKNLRPLLMKMAGEQIRWHDDLIHECWRDVFVTIVYEYSEARKAGYQRESSFHQSAALIPHWEMKVSEHSQQKRPNVYWRFVINRKNHSQRNGGSAMTGHVRMRDRKNLAYHYDDFDPHWKDSPQWERDLVMHTEAVLQWLRRDMRKHQHALREYLHAPEPSWYDHNPMEVIRRNLG